MIHFLRETMPMLATPASTAMPEPLDCPIRDSSNPESSRWKWGLSGFLALGVILRVCRYLLNFPLWGDEGFLAASFIDRDFLSVLGPLEYNMVAPPLFLWGELAAVRLFGFSELSLRLIPTLASVASLFLFWQFGRRWLRGYPLLFAVGIFAVSYYPIRHGNEIKPYATDLLFALALMILATEWLRQPRRVRWLYALAAAAATSLLGSFPAMFVTAGIGLALLPVVWKSGDRRAWIAFGCFGLSVAASFAAVYVLSVKTQAASYDAAGLKSLWNQDFPPLATPLKLAPWLLERHTSHMLSYPVGGGRHASTGTTFLVLVASVFAWRRGYRQLLAISWLSLLFCLAAAALERYPYGGSARTMQFVAPGACLFAGLGLAVVLSYCRRPFERRWGVVLSAGFLLLIGGATFLRDLTAPYKTIYDERSREFAIWFWTEQARDAELVCVKRDQQTVFTPELWMYDRTAVYQSTQAIYSPRHRAQQSPNWDAVSEKHPLRCVIYNEHPTGSPEFIAWRAKMDERYALRDKREYLVNPNVVMRNAPYEDRYVVYEFVPKTTSTARSTSAQQR